LSEVPTGQDIQPPVFFWPRREQPNSLQNRHSYAYGHEPATSQRVRAPASQERTPYRSEKRLRLNRGASQRRGKLMSKRLYGLSRAGAARAPRHDLETFPALEHRMGLVIASGETPETGAWGDEQRLATSSLICSAPRLQYLLDDRANWFTLLGDRPPRSGDGLRAKTSAVDLWTGPASSTSNRRHVRGTYPRSRQRSDSLAAAREQSAAS
jgi:hypothetical protein